MNKATVARSRTASSSQPTKLSNGERIFAVVALALFAIFLSRNPDVILGLFEEFPEEERMTTEAALIKADQSAAAFFRRLP